MRDCERRRVPTRTLEISSIIRKKIRIRKRYAVLYAARTNTTRSDASTRGYNLPTFNTYSSQD